MSWKKVGNWLKDNSDNGVQLVGSLLTGNVTSAIAAGASMVSSATGKDNPDDALNALTTDPQSRVRLCEIAAKKEEDIRAHIETMERLKLEDAQKEQSETQKTIRAGDVSTDVKIRNVRPSMAKQSWFATVVYCLGCFGTRVVTDNDHFDVTLAMLLCSPAWAYLGLRTTDKFAAIRKGK